jgi:hypothetical protein
MCRCPEDVFHLVGIGQGVQVRRGGGMARRSCRVDRSG